MSDTPDSFLGRLTSLSKQHGAPAATGNQAIDRLSTALWAAETGKEWYEKGRNKYRQWTTWSVSVQESEPIFRDLQDWLIESIPRVKQKNISAVAETFLVKTDGVEVKDKRDSVDRMFESSNDSSVSYSKTLIKRGLSSQFSQNVQIQGHSVRVRFTAHQPRSDENNDRTRAFGRGSRDMRNAISNNGVIIFDCRSIAAQDAVLEFLQSMVSQPRKRQPSLWIANSWGDWQSQNAPQRSLTSIVMKEGVKEDLRDDLQRFLSSEGKYTELGIPWHRGYLLHGQPGTGKTSLIKALASDLGLDLWYAPIGDIKEDSSLMDLVRSVRQRGILLLEDVDAYSAARDRDAENGDSGKGVTTSALLNALDGMVTPHGLITVMTTNHVDKLDPALVRSGRADRRIEVGLPEWDEVRQLWAMFFPDEEKLGDEPDAFVGLKISQAQISEILKNSWEDAEKARIQIMDLTSGRMRV